MTIEFVIEMIRMTLVTAGMVAAPVLATALIIGLSVSIFQAVTQINEATLTFIPKMFFSGIVLMITLSWVLGKLKGFMVYIFNYLPNIVN